VLIGDTQQLQAIEAGAAFRAITERISYVELTDIRRQQAPWQAEATRELAKGQVKEAIDRYDRNDHVHTFETGIVAKKEMVSLWNDVRISEPEKTQIMLAYTRLDVKELNERARELRREHGELGEDHHCQTSRGERSFAEQDRVYFLKNDRSLGVLNGTLGTIEKIDGQHLTISLDAKRGEHQAAHVSIDLGHYDHLDHGYAATVHKAQGVTVDRSYVLASKFFDAHVTYVGMSRHRESVDLFWSKDEFSNGHDLAKQLGRDRAKDVTQDYVADKEIETKQLTETSHQEFYLTDEEMKELDEMEKRVGLTQDGLDEFKDSFYKEHPDLAHEADQEFDAYFKEEINCEKSIQPKSRPDVVHLDIDTIVYNEKEPDKASKIERTIDRGKEIDLDLEL
jgi:hypothetical protein